MRKFKSRKCVNQKCVNIRCDRLYFKYFLNHFTDFMNFTSPMSLETFARSNEVEEVSKAIFPYELWDDITKIAECTSFPSLEMFQSSLTKSEGEKWLGEFEDVANAITSDIEENDSKWAKVCEFFEMNLALVSKILVLENGSFQRTESFETNLLPTSPKKYFDSKNFFNQNCLTMLDFLRIGFITLMFYSSQKY